MTEIIKQGWSESKDTGAVFLDVAKAFDKVWTKGLIYKLIQLNIPDALTKLLISYLSDRKFKVRVGRSLSTYKNIKAGIAQGSILAPLCYNIFINDIPRTSRTQLYLFADDTAILSTARNSTTILNDIQRHLNQLEEWLIKWKIKVNVEKSQAVFFSRKRNKPSAPTLNNQIIQWQNQSKYLGIILDQRLTFRPHIEYIKNNYRAAKARLYPILNKDSKMSTKNKILVYKSIFRPLISYAVPIWGIAANTHISKLESLQNVTLRQISKMPWFVRNKNIRQDLKILTLLDFFKKLATSFFNRIDNMDNVVIRSISRYDPFHPVNKRRARRLLT
ncbi:putative RNA-directed DNA polymerase from transposon X-element [Araneus ventricosus]|uniref:Putative RNA-directed DNA polymerase from transposon X-element n=1 Tax=Araneus ventricosus TaxID=182803 RepID=A0A4Y2MWQ7_ARAVE|nr:putative RNA-directed DNA polymerase from transposon X-element [Araneus ventricosus]